MSEHFEFVGRDWSSDHGRRVFVKCKVCGSVFATWSFLDILKNRQSHILCPDCGTASDGEDIFPRTPKADAAIEYYINGHTVAETAYNFGVTTIQINNLVKARGVSNGKTWEEAVKKANERRKKESTELWAKRIESGEYDYLKIWDTHKRRAVKYGCKYDSSITLSRLIEKNGLRCALCGEMCNPNDKTWTTYGPMSPTIDHIIPMAKGGGHTWDNIQIAHAICNSYKSDNIEEAI